MIRQSLLLIAAGALVSPLMPGSAALSCDEILSKIETENIRRHLLLNDYSGTRQYTLQNSRFGQEASVALLMNYSHSEGERYTVLKRSGSGKLNGIIDKVLASEAGASSPLELARHDITSANYRVRLLRNEVTAGRDCYVLDLSPRLKSRFLIAGKAWVDTGSYAVVRIEGQFASSLSVLVGAPRISEEFAEVGGFWMPAHVRSVSSSVLLGPTELDILYSDYRLPSH